MTEPIHAKTEKKLKSILAVKPVDWDAFDKVLAHAEDINSLDKEYDETLLSAMLLDDHFFQNGADMPVVAKHFLANGYDVKANEGTNGILVLGMLCWSSYDKYILDTAKVLLDAGSPVDYEDAENDPDDEPSGVMGDISWKLPGAWSVDKDYIWANVLEAYCSIIEAAAKGKDYQRINSYLDCIGKKLTGVSVFGEEGDHPIRRDGDLTAFSGSLVLWFEDQPLIVSKYIDLVVNPYMAEEGKENLLPAEKYFLPVLRQRLKEVHYANQSICYMDFDEGTRIIFAGRKTDRKEYTGTFEITAAGTVDIAGIETDIICRYDSITYAETADHYDEEAVALISEDKAYLLFTTETESPSYRIECIECSKSILRRFSLKFPVQKPDRIRTVKNNGYTSALCFECGAKNLYFNLSSFRGLDIYLWDNYIEPNERGIFPMLRGEHMEFKTVSF